MRSQRSRLFHDAAQRRNFFQHSRHYAIGSDHEVFNQLGGVIFLLLLHVDNLIIQHEWTEFIGLEVESSVFKTLDSSVSVRRRPAARSCAWRSGRPPLWRVPAVPSSHAPTELYWSCAVIAHQGAIDIAGTDVAARVSHQFDDHTKAVLIFQQGSLARGKFLGQHREVSDSSVDRGRFSRSVLIDGSLFRDERVDIGNADENFHAAIWLSFGNFDLIEIARSVIVNRRPEEVSQIAHIFSRGDLGRVSAQVSQLFLDGRGEIGVESALPHDFFGCGLQIDLSWLGVRHQVLIPTASDPFTTRSQRHRENL